MTPCAAAADGPAAPAAAAAALAGLHERLRRHCEQLGARHDEALRDELLRSVVQPNLAVLRGGNETRWNEAGWCRALGAAEPAGAPAGAAAPFPVAPDSANWYPPELDGRNGALFRFFRRDAWLDLAAPAAPCRLCFSVAHVIMAEALERLVLVVCGVPVAYTLAPQAHACGRVEALLDADVVARARGAGRLRVRLSTPVAALPALLYPGSSDRRLLSLALTLPILTQI